MNSNRVVTSGSKIREFLSDWFPWVFRGDTHELAFGIRNRLVLFISFLIVVAIVISQAKISKTLEYVVSREKVDLKDETRNSKLQIELALQTAYSQVVAKGDRIVHQGERSVGLSPVDPARGIKIAQVNGSIDRDVTVPDHFKPEHVQASFRGSGPCWSEIFWESSEENDSAFIDVLIPQSYLGSARLTTDGTKVETAGAIDTTEPTQQEARLWNVRFEITQLLEELTGPSRILSYFVSSDSNLALAPNGIPRRHGSDPDIDLADASNGVEIPDHVRSAVEDFIQIRNERRQNNPSMVWLGTLYKQAVPVSSMSVDADDPSEFSLHYSETLKLDANIIEELQGSELDEIELELREIDPFVRIDPINPEVAEVRIRASSEELLDLTKGYVELYIQQGGSNTKVKWTNIEMDDFLLSVHCVQLPTIGRGNAEGGEQESEAPILGYLIRASSVAEIRWSAFRDLQPLNNTTNIACAVAIVITLFFAHYLVSPLARMTRVARSVSETGLQPSEMSEAKLNELLGELPTTRRDEVGVLAVQLKKTSRNLLRANCEVQQSARDRIAEQRKYEQSEREKAIADKVSQDRVQLLATVSHDMRQPLLPIFHHSERLLRGTDLNQDQHKRVQTIIKNATELSFLIEDILDYKRILAGDVQISVEAVDLHVLLDDLIQHYADMAGRRKISLVKKSMWSGSIQTDRMRLKRVLNNLISNAIKATRDGEVCLNVSPLGVDHLEISVTDTGCGMDPLQQQLVFEPADRRAKIERQHQGFVTRKDSNSTGLGLYISKQLIEAMGGDIRFTSEAGEGTTFVIKLPVMAPRNVEASLAAGSDRTDEPSRMSQRHRPTAQSPETPKRGLHTAVVVDDDARCTRILSEMLEELGYDAQEVLDGESAIELITRSLPDLVTLDVFMPGIDGWETLRRLKSNRLTEHIPVIMVTVHPDESKATLLGASGFVTKPVDQSSLTNSVLGTIGSRGGARVLAVDDDEMCLNELAELLRPLRCEVSLACDGDEALTVIDDLGDDMFDLAIIDLYMPNLDGFGLIEKLGQMNKTKDMPIIVLSAGVLSDAERTNLEPHVARFFSKGSVDLSTLQDEISRLLAKRLLNQAVS